MLFQVYGDNAIYQWIGWIIVFCCLIGANELARRTKTGGVIAFLVIPAVLTVYFITIYTAAAMGAEWALNNPTYVHMNSWFHYAKLLRGHRRLHRLHCPQIQVGIDRQGALVQVLPVRDRRHQHPDCRSVRLRMRHPPLSGAPRGSPPKA